MKTIYRSLLLFMVCSTLVNKLGAQGLAGAYTINQQLAPSSTNFVSFNALATALTASGVAGPVTVDVASGTGPYIEQVNFGAVTGASSLNRIVINGNNNLITFNSTNTAQRWVIGLNSADFFTFNNLQIQGTGTFAYCAFLYGGADNNVFSACTFSVPLNSITTNQIPVVFSGTATTHVSALNSGNNNLLTGCQMYGGHTSVWMYGPTSGSFTSDNRILNCSFQDFYLYGIYAYYSRNLTLRGNLIERPTRTTLTTGYGTFFIYNQGLMCESNQLRNFFGGNPASTSSAFGIYGYYNSTTNGTNPNVVRNNMVYDMRSNGSLYGIYYYYLDGMIHHNTISLNHNASTATGVTYGVYTYGGPGYPVDMKNNLITISRGGSGTKYCNYVALAGNINIDKDNYFINSTAGLNYIGYYNTNHLTLTSFQSHSLNSNGMSIDPIYTNLATNNLMPTNSLLNNQGVATGLVFDCFGAIRNTSTPDVGALEFLTPVCSGTPTNTVSGPNFALCFGESANFNIGTLNADAGFTYQWQSSSISQVGPFTPIAGANNIFYTANSVTNTTWYSVVITCTAPGGSSIAPVAQVNVAGTTTNNVPYFEGFEGIGANNRLPNCSWSSTNLGSATETFTLVKSGNRLPRTGTSYGTFDLEAGAGTNYYYSNGIFMQPGITYSASVWFQTDLTGAANWTDLSLMIGSAQTPLGLQTITNTAGPAISPIYKSLSNTFTVSAPGLYYMAVRATAAAGTAMYLSIDDLAVTIPCSVPANSPNLILGINTNPVICAGSPINFLVSGADAYQWNHGPTGSAITVNPLNTFTYTVTGTNTLTGCSSQASQLVQVKPLPQVAALAIPESVCAGKPANLTAQGAANYVWNMGGVGSLATVTPTAPSTYTVIGTGINGCSATATVAVKVFSLPIVQATAASENVCKNDVVPLNASGATQYQWVSSANQIVLVGASPSVTHAVTGIVSYTLTGTDNNGCSSTNVLNLTVNACTSIEAGDLAAASVKLYPNPAQNNFQIEIPQSGSKQIVISDVTGRIVFSETTQDQVHNISVNEWSNGVYFVQITGPQGSIMVKLVKE